MWGREMFHSRFFLLYSTRKALGALSSICAGLNSSICLSFCFRFRVDDESSFLHFLHLGDTPLFSSPRPILRSIIHNPINYFILFIQNLKHCHGLLRFLNQLFARSLKSTFGWFHRGVRMLIRGACSSRELSVPFS